MGCIWFFVYWPIDRNTHKMAEWGANGESSNGYSSRAGGQLAKNGYPGSPRHARSSDDGGEGSRRLDLSKICRDGRRTIIKLTKWSLTRQEINDIFVSLMNIFAWRYVEWLNTNFHFFLCVLQCDVNNKWYIQWSARFHILLEGAIILAW